MTFRVLDVPVVRRPLLDHQKDSQRIVFVDVDDENDDDDDDDDEEEEKEKEEEEESMSRERISFDDFFQRDEIHFATQKEASTGVVVAFVETPAGKHEDDDWTVLRLLRLRALGRGRGHGQTAAGSATADRRSATGNGKIGSSSRDESGRGQRAAARVGRCW